MNWLDLPDKIWELILCNLSERDLLNASETCKKFNDLFSTSHKFLELICLNIQFPPRIDDLNETAKENEYLRSIREMKLMRECLRKSQRKYENITISYHENKKDFVTSNYNVTFDILKQFAGSVTQLTFKNTLLHDDNYLEVIQTIKKLKVLKFQGCVDNANKVMSENERLNFVSTIEEIYIQGDSVKFPNLHIFDNITTLDVNDCTSMDFEAFQYFLSLQKSLKVLRFRRQDYRVLMFETDKLSKKIKFSLDELTMNEIYWKNHENAMKFFKTQTNLKIISLGLCSFHACDEILVHLLGNNPQLKTVSLTTHDTFGYTFKNFDFCEGIVNHSVENLTLELYYGQDATQYLIALTKLFPNVKKFTFTVYKEHGFNQIHNWKSLESIDCTLVSIYSLMNLENIDLVEKLTTCTIIIHHKMYFKADKILEFLKRHQNIKHFSIYLDKDYETIPDEFPVLVAKTLKSLETLICDGNKIPLSNYLKPVSLEDQCVTSSEKVSPIVNSVQAFSWKILFSTIIQRLGYYFTKIMK